MTWKQRRMSRYTATAMSVCPGKRVMRRREGIRVALTEWRTEQDEEQREREAEERRFALMVEEEER